MVYENYVLCKSFMEILLILVYVMYIMFFLNVDIEFMYFIYILEYMFVNVLYNLFCK